MRQLRPQRVGQSRTVKFKSMKPEEIKLSDWSRMLFGQTPASFLIEVVLRALIVFVLLVVSMRLMGRRMAGQVTRIEMVALFSLAAAIGVPLQAPDRGLLPAFVIALIVVGVGRAVAARVFYSRSFEAGIKDPIAALVNDGIFDMKKIKGSGMTTERVKAQLRGESIRQLGEVKRLYFQSNGSFALLKEEQPKPGLGILPQYDNDFGNEQQKSGDEVCSNCGQRKQDNPSQICSNCGNNGWTTAVV